jgi:hypothetical protein
MRALSGGGREVRHDDGGVGGHPWSSSAVVEREREKERDLKESTGKLGINQCIHQQGS